MDNYNSKLMTKIPKDENYYKYDNFGNIIADSIDDLLYDKYIVNNEFKSKKELKKIKTKNNNPNEERKKRKVENKKKNSGLNINIDKNKFKLKKSINDEKRILGNHNQKNKKISDIFLIEGKAYNNSIINQEYIIKNNDDLNDSTKLNNKNYMSKLKLNSNHTPIEPMSFENENNRIIKSKYELIFFKPLLSKCYISKVDKAFNKAIHKVRNKDYIFKNGSHPNCITNLFINNASNETKKIHDKKKSFSQKYILSRMNKYKKISKNHSKSKSNLLNPKRNINDEKNIFFLKKKKKKIINKKMKNIYISEKAKSKKLFNSPSKLLNNRNKTKTFFQSQ